MKPHDIKRLFPNASRSLLEANDPVPDPEPERNKATALGATVSGKAAGIRRIRVRFTGYRVRLLDPDNFAGSIKDLLDGARHAALIPGDEPERIILETEQIKVKTHREESTLMEIFYVA